jgi:hypothetical protein
VQAVPNPGVQQSVVTTQVDHSAFNEFSAETLPKERVSVSKDGGITIPLGSGPCKMSPEDALCSLGHDYERRAIELIATRAETPNEIRELIACLSADLDQRKASIRDYFKNREASFRRPS